MLNQTTAIPYMPSKQHPHWSGRMGAAIAVSNVSDVGETYFNGKSFLFLIGGDDYDVDADERSAFDQANRVHGLRNDVWKLAAPDGETWAINTDMIDRTAYDHKLPKQHSLLEWAVVDHGKIPDVGETYERFIECQQYYPGHLAKSRTCSDEIPLRKNGWFSPRRMHQVAIYRNKLFVVGGRARRRRHHRRKADAGRRRLQLLARDVRVEERRLGEPGLGRVLEAHRGGLQVEPARAVVACARLHGRRGEARAHVQPGAALR